MITQRCVPAPTILERAEIVRSDVEAAHASIEKIKLGRRRLRRYSNSSAETNYPLEYAFHLTRAVASGIASTAFLVGSAHDLPIASESTDLASPWRSKKLGSRDVMWTYA